MNYMKELYDIFVKNGGEIQQPLITGTNVNDAILHSTESKIDWDKLENELYKIPFYKNDEIEAYHIKKES